MLKDLLLEELKDLYDAEQLAGGFPKTRDELFSYRGLILGSIEAGAFTGDQLRMIAEFVDRRGGGLLILGGARALSEGGYAGTAVADVLPLVLDPSARNPELAREWVDLVVSEEGQGVLEEWGFEPAAG